MARPAGALALNVLLAPGVLGQETARFVMDGSTGVMPLAAALAEAFQERNPGITIEMGRGLAPVARFLQFVRGPRAKK